MKSGIYKHALLKIIKESENHYTNTTVDGSTLEFCNKIVKIAKESLKNAEMDPIELVRQALEEDAKRPPEEGFDSMVRAGIIDEDGELIRDDD